MKKVFNTSIYMFLMCILSILVSCGDSNDEENKESNNKNEKIVMPTGNETVGVHKINVKISGDISSYSIFVNFGALTNGYKYSQPICLKDGGYLHTNDDMNFNNLEGYDISDLTVYTSSDCLSLICEIAASTKKTDKTLHFDVTTYINDQVNKVYRYDYTTTDAVGGSFVKFIYSSYIDLNKLPKKADSSI